jgi:hypothetical protein
MVALASPASPATDSQPAHRRGLTWEIAAAAVVIAGLALRLALGAGGTGDRSAALMSVLLALAAWTAARLVSTPRVAFVVVLGLVALLDIGDQPPRNSPVYDDRQAIYSTDQLVEARVPLPPGVGQPQPLLSLLVEPVFQATQPAFGLAGDIGGMSLGWSCAFKHGLQRLELPLPPTIIVGAGFVDLRLHLTGSPSRETDYLVVYASANRGGPVASIVAAPELAQGATLCALS